MEERFDKQTQERAVLVGLNADCFAEEDTATESTLDELEDLLETAGGFCTGKVLQNRHTPDSHSFIGEGKAQEVRMLAEATQSTMVIFDNELSPGNIRALEEIIGLPVLDRSALILDIFAQRAKTKEGRLQVELAQYKYLLPGCPAWARAFPGRAAASAPGAPARPSWNLTGGISGSASTVWKKSWSRCARCAPSSGSGE